MHSLRRLRFLFAAPSQTCKSNSIGGARVAMRMSTNLFVPLRETTSRFCRSASGQRHRGNQCFKRRFESICADSGWTRLSASPGVSSQAGDDAACHRCRSNHRIRASRVDPQVGRCESYRTRSGHALRPSLALARCRSLWDSKQSAKAVSSLPTQWLARSIPLTSVPRLRWTPAKRIAASRRTGLQCGPQHGAA